MTHSEELMRLDDVSLSFATRIRQPAKQAQVGGRIEANKGRGSSIYAIDSLNLSIKSGQRIALIGHNGAGKSTFLRLAAGILHPTSGSITRNTTVSTLFTTSLGLHNDNSAVKNIEEAGILYGFKKKEMKKVTADVLEFAELGAFADLPFRQLSSGMRARVGFGLATSISKGVILIDEIFATGDAKFREKAKKRLTDILDRSGALVMASHTDGILRSFCEEGMVMKQGKMTFFGPLDEAMQHYADNQ